MTDPVRALRPGPRSGSLIAMIGLLAALVPAGTAAAAEPKLETSRADQVLVRYARGLDAAERAQTLRDHRLTELRTSPDGRTQVVVAEGRSPATARRELRQDPNVVAVSDNFHREIADDITDEPLFTPESWGLHNTGQRLTGTATQTGIADVDIDGLEALRIQRGASDIVVAVIDDGVDFSHPDLASAAWTNPGEAGALATNGIDDDANGYIDDVHGWDFCNDDNTVSDPGEDFHGTHVAGTIAGALNGTGIVGVAPGVRIMALKFLQDETTPVPQCGWDDQAIAAIDYAASFGVPIINASWGGKGTSPVMDVAIGESDTLFVAAAGNEGWDIDAVGGPRFFPAGSTQPNVLTVAAIDQRGQLAAFSNYGTTSVDLSAPGTNIVSAITSDADRDCDPCWAWMGGTSMAAPHASGVAALVASSLSRSATPANLRARILNRAVGLSPTVGRTVTGRLLNALRAIDATAPTAGAIDRYGFSVGSVLGTSSITGTLAWPAATDTQSGVRDYTLLRSAGGGSFATFLASTTARTATRALTYGTGYRFRVQARDVAGNLSAPKDGPVVTASLLQDGTSLATYAGTWSTVTTATASNGKLHRSTRAGASVTFRTNARAVALVARRGPGNGQAKVYVDGVYTKTIDLYRSSTQGKVVMFQTSWTTNALHTIKVVVVGTAGRPAVEVDAFAILR